jgi:gluconolactonase
MLQKQRFTESNPAAEEPRALNRRAFLGAASAAAAISAVTPQALAQTQGFPVGPAPIRYPDSVWKVLDDRFKKYIIGNTPLVREWTGAFWAEGPAWDGVGRYVVFSDIPNNRQMRWDEVSGEVTLLRTPSNFSNGNTFDWQGRQLSCEHETARVVRYEYEGEPTILAETFEGKPLNAPNDVVVHPDDDGIIFTDPGYGSHWYYEGNVRELELPTSVYHIDAQSGQLTRLTDEIFKPNGLCFSPDYSILYVADTAPTHHPGEKAKIIAWDVQDNGHVGTICHYILQLRFVY